MKRGEVYYVALDPTIGVEKQKTRPCVIVRRDMVDEVSEERNPLTIVVPLNDAKGREGNTLNAFVPRGTAGTVKDSLVVCSQIRAVDKRRFAGDKVGELPPKIMRQVDRGLAVVLALDT